MAHYYDANPAAPSSPKEMAFRLNGIDFSFVTDSGVFSKTKLDFGSELLLKTVLADLSGKVGSGASLLDLGCGYGPLGIVLKRIFPALTVTMADINERAAALAGENARRNLVKFADIRISDGFSGIPELFDVIVTNPPIRAGKQKVFAFYEGSFSHLRTGGVLYVVIQKKQGAPSSVEKLQALFGNCGVIERDAGYWILKSTKQEEQKEESV